MMRMTIAERQQLAAAAEDSAAAAAASGCDDDDDGDDERRIGSSCSGSRFWISSECSFRWICGSCGSSKLK